MEKNAIDPEMKKTGNAKGMALIGLLSLLTSILVIFGPLLSGILAGMADKKREGLVRPHSLPMAALIGCVIGTLIFFNSDWTLKARVIILSANLLGLLLGIAGSYIRNKKIIED